MHRPTQVGFCDSSIICYLYDQSVFVQKRKVPEATGWEVLCVKGSYNYLGALTRPPLQKFPKAFALENYRSIVVPLLIKLVDCIVITT